MITVSHRFFEELRPRLCAAGLTDISTLTVWRAGSRRLFDEIVSGDHNAAIAEAVELFVSEFEALTERRSVDVLVCAVPPQVVALREPDEDEPGAKANRFDFHNMLKARAMRTKIPIQLVLPDTYDQGPRRRQKIRSTRLPTKQDEATTAWNFHTALYYKANGYPWRLVSLRMRLERVIDRTVSACVAMTCDPLFQAQVGLGQHRANGATALRRDAVQSPAPRTRAPARG